MNGAVQTFYFAVIDGADPKSWPPFDGEDKTFEVLRQECMTSLSLRIANEEDPRVAFDPMLEPIEKLLKSARLHGIVGVLIQASADPVDLVFYEEKMTNLEKLCARIRASATPECLLLNKVGQFEIWFLTTATDIERWAPWETRANDIVKRAFGHLPRIDYLPTGSLFPQLARRFLNKTRYAMLWGRG